MGEVTVDSSLLKARLLDIWEEFLGPGLSEKDDFFRLGGQSITAVRISREIEQRMGLTVPASVILRNPTVSALAGALEAEADRFSHGPRQLSPRAAAPLTPAQEQMWTMEMAVPEAAFFTELVRIRFDGPLDRRALGLALAEAVGRHDVLRTRIRSDGGGFAQVATRDVELDLWEVELGPLSPAETRRVGDLVSAERRTAGFDLTGEPPIRATLASFGRTSHLLLLELHHIVFDGFSRDLLVRELATLYSAFAGGREPALPPLPMQFGDFARWQREHYSGEVLARHLDFWTERLADPGPPLRLSSDGSAEERYTSGDLTFQLPRDLAVELERLGSGLGATLFMTLLAGFAVSLHRRTEETDFPIASMVANRSWPATQSLVGLFANVIVTRIRVDPRQSFHHLLTTVRDAALEGFRHEGLPFETLLGALDRAGADRRRLLQTGFGLHPPYSPPIAIPGGTMSVLRKEESAGGEGTVNPSTFDLTLEMREVADGLGGHVQYKDHLFDRTEAKALVDELERTLAAVAAQPDIALEQIG
jgi:hypothetical protein